MLYLKKLVDRSGMMMPPKKSKAARESGAIVDSQQNGTAADEEGVQEEVNVFKAEILLTKRPRNLPASEQNFKTWINKHLEATDNEEVRLKLSDVYESYRSACSSSATTAVESNVFYRMIKEEFPKNFQLKEGSPYESAIRKRKPKSKKTAEKKKDTGDYPKLNLKEVIETTINEFGNPTKGVQFAALKKRLSAKYPSLNLDQKPQFLMMILMRGIRNRFLECVRGIGRCGFYRLCGPPTPEEQEREENLKKMKKEKGLKKEGEEEEEEKEEGGEEKTEGEGGEPKDEGELKEGEETEEKTEQPKKLRARKPKAKKADMRKKPKGKGKKKATAKVYRSYIIHSDPQRIEDTFPLAMTYMCEPKEASARKIQKYIERYYRADLPHDKFRKALDTGLEKGFWDQVSGSGLSGKFRLDIDEFDPTDDDDLIGQIVNAIVACTEPKTCSSNLLKKYLLEYHQDFNTEKRPDLYKRALERGIRKGIIRQISGIGSSGSFQLAEEFMPSPTILHGDDSDSDYFEPAHDKEDTLPEYGMDISQFRDAYVPRPSKRRGHARTGAVLNIEKMQLPVGPSHPKRRKLKQKGPLREARSRLYDESSSDEEESSEEESSEEEEVVAPRKRKAVKGRGSAAKKAPPKRAAPKKAARKRAAPAAKKKATASSRAARSPRKSYAEGSDNDDEEEEDVKPTPSRKGRSPKKRYAEASSSEEDAANSSDGEEQTPKKKSRSTPAKKTASKGKKGGGKKGKARRK